MTPNELIRSLSDVELRQACAEALAWHQKGVLEGTALRAIAERLSALMGEADGVIRLAESLVIAEAAARFVQKG